MNAPRAIVWLDRDGTLVDDPGYLSDPLALRLLPGAGDAVARLRDAGATIVLVTNQSGIGRGIFAEDDLDAVHAALHDALAARGTALDRIEVCPHAPAADGTSACACRKPAPGMIDRARRALGVDASTPQVVVGDKVADVELARNAGCAAVVVTTGEGAATAGAIEADHVAPDLVAAVPWILRRLGLASDGGDC